MTMKKTEAIKTATALVAVPVATTVMRMYAIVGRFNVNDIHTTTTYAYGFRDAQRDRAAWIATLALELMGVSGARSKVNQHLKGRNTNPTIPAIVGALYK